jgi:hypothetical protein
MLTDLSFPHLKMKKVESLFANAKNLLIPLCELTYIMLNELFNEIISGEKKNTNFYRFI